MIHLGKTLNRPLSLREYLLTPQNSYRGLVRISPNADNARNFSQCDLLLMEIIVVHIPFLTLKVNHQQKLNTRLQQ
jgi:hypothetical protein